MLKLKITKNVDSIKGDPLEKKEPTTINGELLNDKNKHDWNDFLSFLKTKGVQGNPELDKGNLGNIYFDQYVKQNPATTLSKELIPKIRQQYIAERNKGIEALKSGKSKLQGQENVNPESLDFSRFMRHIVDNEQSKDPNYIGQHLTRTPFAGMVLHDQAGKVLASRPFQTVNNLDKNWNEMKQIAKKNL